MMTTITRPAVHVRTARPDPRLGVVRRYTVHVDGSFAGWVNRYRSPIDEVERWRAYHPGVGELTHCIRPVGGRVRFRDAVAVLVQETIR